MKYQLRMTWFRYIKPWLTRHPVIGFIVFAFINPAIPMIPMISGAWLGLSAAAQAHGLL